MRGQVETMTEDRSLSARTLSARQWLLVLLVGCAALLPGLFQIPAMDRDEARYAQASRQMIETGDFVDIRFQEVPRHVKPIGTYWLQAASASVFGGADAPIAAYRLPSVAGTIVAVVLTAWFTTKLAGAPAGVAAGLLLALALVSGVEARTAKTDALLLASILAAQIALHRLATRPDDPGLFGGGWRSAAAFWLFHGIGVLIKGPIVTLVCGTTILAWSIWTRDATLLRRLRVLPGLLITVAVVAPWVVAITLKVGPAFLEEAIGHALLGKVAQGDDAHGAPPGYHTIAFLIAFWPGAVLAAGAAILAWVRRNDPDIRFLICWIVPTILVFELVATKLPHYTYPTYPAIAVLTAVFLTSALDLVAEGRRRIAHRVVMGLGLLVTLVLAAVPLGATLHLTGEVSLVAAIATAAGLAVVAQMVHFLRALSLERLIPLAISICVFYALTFAGVAPRLDPLWISRALEPVVVAEAGCPDPIVVTAGFSEPSMVFVHGTATRLSDGAGAARTLAEPGLCSVAVVERRQQERFDAGLGELGVEVEPVGTVSGLNYSRGRDIAITIYRRVQ